MPIAIQPSRLERQSLCHQRLGGDHSHGAHLATEIGFAASNVRSAVINNSGHWIMEEQPQQAISIIIQFLEEKTKR
jgi:pimeloyl-ACP methyl ester carboxylesterase